MGELIDMAVAKAARGAKKVASTVGNYLPVVGNAMDSVKAHDKRSHDSARARAAEKGGKLAHSVENLGELLKREVGSVRALENSVIYLDKSGKLPHNVAAGIYDDIEKAYDLLESAYGAMQSGRAANDASYAHQVREGKRHRNNVYEDLTTYGKTAAILILAGALGMIAFTATNVTGAVVGAPISDFNVVAASIFAIIAVVGVLVSLRR